MTIRAVNDFEPVWFTPASQKRSESPARFLLKGLDGHGQARLAPELLFDGPDIELSTEALRLFFELGLIDWEGIIDRNESPIPFPGPAAAQKHIPYKVQTELARELFTITFTPADDKKKS